jgi:hypothetical protein
MSNCDFFVYTIPWKHLSYIGFPSSIFIEWSLLIKRFCNVSQQILRFVISMMYGMFIFYKMIRIMNALLFWILVTTRFCPIVEVVGPHAGIAWPTPLAIGITCLRVVGGHASSQRFFQLNKQLILNFKTTKFMTPFNLLAFGKLKLCFLAIIWRFEYDQISLWNIDHT